MNEEKLRRFVNDPATSEAVYRFLLDSFLKEKKGQDVQLLAASRIAVDLLRQGWNELGRLKSEKNKNEVAETNVGI